MKINVYKYDGTVYEIEAPEVIVPPDPDPVEPKTDGVTWDVMAEAITEGVNEV